MRTSVLVSEFIVSMRSKGDRPCTLRWYRSILGTFAGAFKILPAAPRQVEGYLAAREISPESRRSTIRALRAFYTWARRRHKVPNPMKQITMPRRRRQVPYSLSAVELAWLLAVPLPPRDRALILLLVDTGVRIGEALNLCREDLMDGYIRVDGKTGEREVPISPEVRNLLLKVSSKGYIFRNSRGRMSIDCAYDTVKKAFELAGISAKKKGPHVLRHTFGRQYIAAGGDLVSLQRIMGHADIATTRIYVELDLQDITAQHTRFTPLLAAQKSAQGLMFVDHRPELRPEVRN